MSMWVWASKSEKIICLGGWRIYAYIWIRMMSELIHASLLDTECYWATSCGDLCNDMCLLVPVTSAGISVRSIAAVSSVSLLVRLFSCVQSHSGGNQRLKGAGCEDLVASSTLKS